MGSATVRVLFDRCQFVLQRLGIERSAGATAVSEVDGGRAGNPQLFAECQHLVVWRWAARRDCRRQLTVQYPVAPRLAAIGRAPDIFRLDGGIVRQDVEQEG